MKKYVFLAASALTLASCSSDDFLGENPGNVQNATTAINFSGDAGKITRATSNEGDDHVKLDNQFKVYGVKKTNEKFVTVFKDYSVLYNENLTTSNTNKWEYVKDNQTIKYWDYSASEYRFVAGSPISAFTFKVPSDGTTKNIESATITGLGGHIVANTSETANTFNPVYVAEPKVVANADYKNTVQFNFVRQQSMVRVGFYETIPGYSVTNIKFYEADGTSATSNNVILTSATEGYFIGGTDISGTVTYDWTTATPSYTFAYTDNTNLKKSKNWYAGKLGTLENKSTAKVELLYGTDKDMSAATGYFTVLPTQVATASPILIKCDYELTSDDDSGETINVKGATAAIPAAFSKWEANTRYTYLFKISDNTNGTTGKPGTDIPGLYPITFDAVVKDEKQGTITTVATPSITTYQEGSVVENSGIKYVKDKEIKVTVTDNTNGAIKTLSTDGATEGSVAVYKLSQERTEADLQINNIKTSELAPTNSVDVALAADNKSFTFTPDAEGYYAIQYLTTAATEGTQVAYTYKIVYVE